MEKREKRVPTNEEVENYIRELKINVGNKEKISELLDNQDLLVEYLRKIGVNSNWLDRAAIVEITKEKMRKILKSKDAQVSDTGIKYGRNQLCVKNGEFYIQYTGKEAECIKFIPSTAVEDKTKKGEARLVKDKMFIENPVEADTDFVEYTECKNDKYAVGKVIDRNGVVILEHKYTPSYALGVNFGLVQDGVYLRDSESNIINTTTAAGVGVEREKFDRDEEDFGFPITAIPKADTRVCELMRKYPGFKKWFEDRNFDIDRIISKVEKSQEYKFKELDFYFKHEYETSKSTAEKFVKREKKLQEFYKYIDGQKPSKKRVFSKALDKELNRYRNFRYVKTVFNEKMQRAVNEELDIPEEDLYVTKYETHEDFDEEAKRRLDAKNKKLDIDVNSQTEQERRIAFLAEREMMFEEIDEQRDIINTCSREFENQTAEIKCLKDTLKRIPFIGDRLIKIFTREEHE